MRFSTVDDDKAFRDLVFEIPQGRNPVGKTCFSIKVAAAEEI